MPAKKPTNQTKVTKPAVAKKATSNRHKLLGGVWIVLGIILLAYLAVGLWVLLTGTTSSFARTITTVFPYPASKIVMPGYLGWEVLSLLVYGLFLVSAGYLIYLAVKREFKRWQRVLPALVVFVLAVVGLVTVPKPTNTVVSYHAYLDRYQSLKKFQDQQNKAAGGQNASQTSDDQLKAAALNQLTVLDKAITQEAKMRGVSVSSKDVNAAYKQYADRLQGEANLKKQLKDYLGWGPSQFKEEIRLKLLQDKLNAKLATDDKLNADRKQKAEDFLNQVKQQNKDFAEVAKQSDDPAAANGGDQGFIKRGETEQAVESAIFSLDTNQISDIIKTQQGYVIVQVVEKQPDQVRVRSILVKNRTLSDYIPEQLKQARVSIFVKGLVWDNTVTSVQPKNKPATTQPTAPASPGVAPAAPASPATQ